MCRSGGVTECAADLTTRCHELLEKHSAAGRLTSVSRLEVFFCLSIGRNPDFLPETQQSVGLVSLIVLKTPLFYMFIYQCGICRRRPTYKTISQPSSHIPKKLV